MKLKFILLLILISAFFASCQEPFFDRPAVIGKKLDSFPPEIQGVYDFAIWNKEKAKWERDTAGDGEFVYLHPTELLWAGQGDTTGPDNIRIVFDGKHNIISHKKGRYYFSQAEMEVRGRDTTLFYIMRMMEQRKDGLYLKYIDMGLLQNEMESDEMGMDSSIIVKMKKTFTLTSEYYDRHGCYDGCTKYFFKMDEKNWSASSKKKYGMRRLYCSSEEISIYNETHIAFTAV